MTFKTYIQRPPTYKFIQWDGKSLAEVREAFKYLDIKPTFTDGVLCDLSIDYPDGHPTKGCYRPELASVGDYLAIPEHIISGIPIIHLTKERFEQLYEELDDI